MFGFKQRANQICLICTESKPTHKFLTIKAGDPPFTITREFSICKDCRRVPKFVFNSALLHQIELEDCW